MNTGSIDNEMHLESKLATTLNRIQPDPGFVDYVYRKIMHPTYLRVEKVKSGIGLITIGFGLFLGALVIWVVKKVRDNRG
jgi:hypothetical protein